MNNAIEIKNLCKNYPSFTLKDVNITLPKGFIMGFIGANGAGKSTTISALLGLVKADEGSRLIDGKAMADMTKEEKEKIGVVLDECCFPETLSVTQIDKFSKHIYKNWDSKTYFDYCKKFSLPLKEKTGKFSKGMKMKLCIAAALSHGATTLILDEATGGLDPIIRDEILDILLEFVQDEENSVFISSHIISDLEKICDYITFIKEGKIIFSQEKDTLTQKYGILRCTNRDFEKVDKTSVLFSHSNSFAVDALVYKDKIPAGYVVDNAGIEDVMLYFVKGDEI